MNPKIRCIHKNNILSHVTVVIDTGADRKRIGKVPRKVFGNVFQTAICGNIPVPGYRLLVETKEWVE